MRSDCDDYKQSGARSRRSVGAAKSKQPPPAHIDESKGKGFSVAYSDSCSCTPSSSIRAPQSRSRASPFLAPFRLARESFTIADNHEHNEGIGSQPLALKVLFLLTNAPYFLAALKMFVSTQRPLPIVSGLRCFCEVASFNVFFVCLLAFISSTFHFKQCFCCRSKAELDSCVWWNDIDIKCAGEYLLRANESRAIEWRRTAQACACFEVFFFLIQSHAPRLCPLHPWQEPTAFICLRAFSRGACCTSFRRLFSWSWAAFASFKDGTRFTSSFTACGMWEVPFTSTTPFVTTVTAC